MKICWDNLEDLKYTKSGNLWNNKKKRAYKIVESCKNCGEEFISYRSCKGIYCSTSCRNTDILTGNHLSEEHKRKVSKQSKRLWQNPEHRKNMSEKFSGSNNPAWKGGYKKKNIATYDNYAPQIEWCEEVRRNKEDENILEVKCDYCGKWYIPTRRSVIQRIGSLNGKVGGEQRLYCSKECKKECPIFWQHLSPKDFKPATSREVQPELRQMVLERDDYQCIKCGSEKSLHCHHLEGIRWEPLESADIDKCVTLCKSCHIEVHKLPDCGYHELQCAA